MNLPVRPAFSTFWSLSIIALVFLFAPAGNAWTQTYVEGYIVDQSNAQPLAYVQVFTEGEQGSLSNAEGYFRLAVNRLPVQLKFRQIGFEPMTVSVAQAGELLLVQLNPVSYELNTIEIAEKESNLPYKLLWSSVVKTRRALLGRAQGKLFLRSHTQVDDSLALEQLAAYYNYYFVDGKVDSLSLKAGDLRLPQGSYFMNQGLPYLVRNYAPFREGQALMPSSPFDLNSWRGIKRWFRVRLAEKIPTETDTLLRYEFEAREAGAVFGGEAFVQQSDEGLRELRLRIVDAKHIPFYSLVDQSEDALDQLKMEIRIAFEGGIRALRYRLMTYDLQYRISQSRKIHTQASLWFFNSGSLFSTPILPIDPPLEEYEKLAYYPYDSAFWQSQPNIPLATNEKAQSADLQSVRPYDVQQNSSLALLSNRIEYWYEGWQLDTQRVGITPSIEAKYNILEKSSLAYEYDSIYASTHLYFDYDCYPDTVIYQLEAVIDYAQSYLIPRDSLSQVFFTSFLSISRFHANRMRAMIRFRFGNECPDPKAIQDLYEEVDQTRRQDIANYFANLNMNRPEKFKIKVAQLVADRLKESESFE